MEAIVDTRQPQIMAEPFTRAEDIGLSGHHLYLWLRCPDCGKERWVQKQSFKRGNRLGLCIICANKRRQRDIKGNDYLKVKLEPDSFFYPMTIRGWVREHRLVMAKHLNRCLLPWEVVHHINGIRDDNRVENLKLLSALSYHFLDTLVKRHIRKLEKKLDNQTKEIRLLRWQVKELQQTKVL